MGLNLSSLQTKIDSDFVDFRTQEDAQKWKGEFDEVVNYAWGNIELLILKLPE